MFIDNAAYRTMSLQCLWRHIAGVEDRSSHSVALGGGGEWSASCPSYFTRGKGLRYTLKMKMRVYGPQNRSGRCVEQEAVFLLVFELRTVQPLG